jgi:hypothetical protein
MARGTGTTTKQMRNAPFGAIYIWVNGDTSYAKELAQKIGRDDLEIVRPTWLEYRRWQGRLLTAIVCDHALYLDYDTRELLHEASMRIRGPAL